MTTRIDFNFGILGGLCSANCSQQQQQPLNTPTSATKTSTSLFFDLNQPESPLTQTLFDISSSEISSSGVSSSSGSIIDSSTSELSTDLFESSYSRKYFQIQESNQSNLSSKGQERLFHYDTFAVDSQKGGREDHPHQQEGEDSKISETTHSHSLRSSPSPPSSGSTMIMEGIDSLTHVNLTSDAPAFSLLSFDTYKLPSESDDVTESPEKSGSLITLQPVDVKRIGRRGEKITSQTIKSRSGGANSSDPGSPSGSLSSGASSSTAVTTASSSSSSLRISKFKKEKKDDRHGIRSSSGGKNKGLGNTLTVHVVHEPSSPTATTSAAASTTCTSSTSGASGSLTTASSSMRSTTGGIVGSSSSLLMSRSPLMSDTLNTPVSTNADVHSFFPCVVTNIPDPVPITGMISFPQRYIRIQDHFSLFILFNER